MYSTIHLLFVCSIYLPIQCVLATSTWVDMHLLLTHTMFPDSSVHSAHPVGHTEIIRQLCYCISFYITKKYKIKYIDCLLQSTCNLHVATATGVLKIQASGDSLYLSDIFHSRLKQKCKNCKSQFISKYKYTDCVLLSPSKAPSYVGDS